VVGKSPVPSKAPTILSLTFSTTVVNATVDPVTFTMSLKFADNQTQGNRFSLTDPIAQ
jgi:hypothetical protein